MVVHRGLILVAAITLQIASWFDIQGAAGRLLHMSPTPMTPMQTAQLVGSGILLLLFTAIRPKEKPDAE